MLMEMQTLATSHLGACACMRARARASILDGKRAIEALRGYIDELEQRRGGDLTTRQTDAMIKLTRALISSIKFHMQESAEAERQWAKLQSNIESEFSLTGRFRKTVANVLEAAGISQH